MKMRYIEGDSRVGAHPDEHPAVCCPFLSCFLAIAARCIVLNSCIRSACQSIFFPVFVHIFTDEHTHRGKEILVLRVFCLVYQKINFFCFVFRISIVSGLSIDFNSRFIVNSISLWKKISPLFPDYENLHKDVPPPFSFHVKRYRQLVSVGWREMANWIAKYLKHRATRQSSFCTLGNIHHNGSRMNKSGGSAAWGGRNVRGSLIWRYNMFQVFFIVDGRTWKTGNVWYTTQLSARADM